jgi:hypothetical protein
MQDGFVAEKIAYTALAARQKVVGGQRRFIGTR